MYKIYLVNNDWKSTDNLLCECSTEDEANAVLDAEMRKYVRDVFYIRKIMWDKNTIIYDFGSHSTFLKMVKEKFKPYWNLVETFFGDKDAIDKEDAYQMLCNYEIRIHNTYERECHKEDVKSVLEEKGVSKFFTDADVESVVTEYEDKLCDSEEWHIILNDIINRRL